MNKKENQIPNKNPKDNNNSSLYSFFGLEKSDITAKTDTIKEIREENYLKINTNNQFDIYDTEESDKKLNEIIAYAEDLIQVKSNKEMLRNFVEYLFPKCDREPFIISKYISRKFLKSKKKKQKNYRRKNRIFLFEKNRIKIFTKIYLNQRKYK